MPRWLKILITAAANWRADNAFKHSAAVSFYTLFSLAPITIIAVGLTGVFFSKEVAIKQFSVQMEELVGKSGAEVIQKVMEANAIEDMGGWATAIGIGQDVASHVALQSDGKIVVAGYSQNADTSFYDFALVRYNLDGSLGPVALQDANGAASPVTLTLTTAAGPTAARGMWSSGSRALGDADHSRHHEQPAVALEQCAGRPRGVLFIEVWRRLGERQA